MKLAGRGQVIDRAGRHDRRANLVRAHLIHTVEVQHAARPPIGIGRLVGDRSPDHIELLDPEAADELVNVDIRHGIIFNRDDGFVFRPQMPEIVERIIGVVPEERAPRDMREADPHEIGFLITNGAIEMDAAGGLMGFIDHQINVAGRRRLNNMRQSSLYEIVSRKRLEKYSVTLAGHVTVLLPIEMCRDMRARQLAVASAGGENGSDRSWMSTKPSRAKAAFTVDAGEPSAS